MPNAGSQVPQIQGEKPTDGIVILVVFCRLIFSQGGETFQPLLL